MKIFITDEQKAEPERLHDTTRDGHVRDCIKARLLASEGWRSAMIDQDLQPHETTLNRHIRDYHDDHKLKPETAALAVCAAPVKQRV